MDWLDHSTVQHVSIRSGKRIIKGVIEDVSWEQGSEADEGAGRNREPLSN